MSSCGTTGEAESTSTDFQCVQCGFPVKTLYIQYSPGNIRLVKCGNCKAVADGYIECEIMILILDLILHKPKAYRHVFYNMLSKKTVNFESFLWKLVLAYGILDIYKMWVLSTNEKEYTMPANFTPFLLELGKILGGVMLGIFVFLCLLFCGTRKLLSEATGFYGWKQILFAVIVSSYFKIFLLAMMAVFITVIIPLRLLQSLILLYFLGLGISFLCDHNRGHFCLIIQQRSFKSDNQLDNDEMPGCLFLGTWGEVLGQSQQSLCVLKMCQIRIKEIGCDFDIELVFVSIGLVFYRFLIPCSR